MKGLRYSDIQSKPTEVLDLTSLTPEEFEIRIAPFEKKFQAHMLKGCIDGKPRRSRSYSTYHNCPLPTPQDRLLFVLTYLKTNALQVVHGKLFAMPQGKTNMWLHVLLPVLRAALKRVGDAPSRSIEELTQRLSMTERYDAPPFCHDGTERRNQRPKEPTQQTLCYSGKKKGTRGEEPPAHRLDPEYHFPE